MSTEVPAATKETRTPVRFKEPEAATPSTTGKHAAEFREKVQAAKKADTDPGEVSADSDPWKPLKEEEGSGDVDSNAADRGDEDDVEQHSEVRSQGSSSQGASSVQSINTNKEAALTKLLEMVPGKTKENLIYDLESAEEAKKIENETDELEACASDNERAKRFYAEMLDNPFSAVIVVDTHSQLIVWVNGFASFLFNRIESELVGQDVSILIGVVPGRNNRSWHRKKFAQFITTWADVQAQPESKIVSGRIRELVATRYEGFQKRPMHVQAVIRPVRMAQVDPSSPPFALVGYFRDITVEKHMKASLMTYQFITANASEAMVIADLRGSIKYINSAACHMFGYNADFLLTSEANVSIFCPVAVASVHDKYMKSFRERSVQPGYDIRASPIIGKSRDLVARRSDGEAIELEIRVEIHIDVSHSGNDRLVAYFRDMRELIKASEFKLEVSKRLFPESIAKIVAQKEEKEIRLVHTYKNVPVILCDMVNFTSRTRAWDSEQTFDYLNAFYRAAAEISVGYQAEVVKATGDGIIAVCGIDEFDDPKSRMDRATCFALSLLKWTQKNRYEIRVGIGYGELGSAVFEISKGRPTWDIWAAAVCEASRMEHFAGKQKLQLMLTAYKHLHEPGLKELFDLKEYSEGIKGLAEGGKVFAYETTIDDLTKADPICEKVLNAALSRVFLKKENQRSLLEQQKRRELTGSM